LVHGQLDVGFDYGRNWTQLVAVDSRDLR
jgi:hypothetical protein